METGLQPRVANRVPALATVCSVSEWRDYWRNVCAPKLRARKRELGREVPEREIAAAVESASGKRSERGLVSLWLLGKREPYISQFFALCEKLELNHAEVLHHTAKPARIPLARVAEPAPTQYRVRKTRSAKKR